LELNELLNEREWRKCRAPVGATVDELVDAFEHFCSTYVYIKHPERGRILFELREAQRETVRKWMTDRYSIALKARQIGFSTLGATYALWLTFFWPDRFVVMLSRTEREAQKLLAKSKYAHKFLPLWMRERGPEVTSDNQLKLTFSNESAIESLPSGNDPARGESVYLVIVDEWAFLPNPEEAWASIEPIADVGGRVIGLSTANGSGNFFHSIWVGAQTGVNNFKGIFWPWSAGDRDDDWYEAKARNMPSWQLHQEYPRTPDEAFIKSGNPVFDVDVLMGLATTEPDRGAIVPSGQHHRPSFIQGTNGPLSVWEWPQLGAVYCIGADVAEGLGHGDFSSAHVVDVKTQAVVAQWHGHIAPDLFGEMLSELGWWYSGALLAVENNNHGLTTLKAAQRYGYKNLFRQRKLGVRYPVAGEVLGWRTTTASKPLCIDELAGAIREGSVEIPCEFTIGELRTYVRAPNGRTHGSPHDDRVMSLAICWQMLKYVWLPEYTVESEAPQWSLDWWAKNLVSNEFAFERVPIGAYNSRSGR